MLASGPILVHVVNSGTDWLSLAAVISTGVVGLAGIGAAVWQASRGWAREEKRASTAEKRRIYAECYSAFWAVIDPMVTDRVFRSAGKQDLQRSNDPVLKAASETVLLALSELLLIAPDDLTSTALAADKARAAYVEKSRTDPDDPEGSSHRTFSALLAELAIAMRIDLGSAGLEDQQELTEAAKQRSLAAETEGQPVGAEGDSADPEVAPSS